MKHDNFVPFGRPQSGTVIIQLMTELDVSNNRLESKAVCYFFRIKTACHNAQCTCFENIKPTGIFVKYTLCSLY